jgi:hypothetical protein
MTRRLRNSALTLAIAALPATLAVAPAHAAKGMEVATQDDAVLVNQSYYSRASEFKLLAKLQVTRIRVNVQWANVVNQAKSKKRPSKITYNWTPYDQLLNQATANGVKLQLALSGQAPAWATGNHKLGPYKPNAKLYGQFAKDAATHFRGYVDRISIYNEPNFVGWIAPLKSAPKIYRKLYVAGYNAIKRVDPTIKVLIGETSPYAEPKRATAPLAFLRGVVAGGGLKADGYAHHPYDYLHAPSYRYPGRDNVTLGTLSRLETALDSLAASGKLITPEGDPLDIYLTEYGYMHGGKYRTPESRRAGYLVQAFKLAQKDERVKEMLQFLVIEPPKKYRFFDMSIASRSGQPTSTFRALASWAKDAADSGDIAKPVPPNGSSGNTTP